MANKPVADSRRGTQARLGALREPGRAGIVSLAAALVPVLLICLLATPIYPMSPDEQVQQLEAAGVHVVVSDAQDIEGVYTAIHMIGELVGKQDEAASVVESMQKTFDEIKANAGDGTKTVYFEVSPLQYGLWTAGSGTFMDEIANMLGLTNCFADVTGWGEISEEQVLERNPDYIVTISMYFGEGPTPEEEILSRTGWENVTAVKNGKILNLTNNELSRPAPRLADGAKALYDFVYGE